MTAKIEKGPLLGQRHLQVLLLFLGVVVNFIAKINASIAVVAMTNAETTNPNFAEYNWNEMEKSLILSSFFWGYIITQYPGSYLCRRFGVKRTLFISTCGSSIFTLFIPYAVDWGGWKIYCAIRVIQGLFQGAQFPCVFAHLAVWCPINERTRLGALANMGIDCGTVAAMLLSGWIAASSLGWPGISYMSFILGSTWCIAWLILGANTPRDSKYITTAERIYIESSQNVTENGEHNNFYNGVVVKIPIPWKAIFTSLPFWGLVIIRCTGSWGFYTLQNNMPAYMNAILGMDMKSNAIFSALPYLAMWIMSYVFLIVSDILLQRNILTLNALRKTINSIAFWLPAIGITIVSFLDESQKYYVIALLIVIVGLTSGSAIGSTLNTIDLSPNHAGTIMGISNTFANVIPILTPIINGAIITDEHNRNQWQIVFFITSIVMGLGNLLYIAFGSTNPQPWNEVNYLKKLSKP